MVVLRCVAESDAAELAALTHQHRDYLAPWEPRRSAEYYTEHGQLSMINHALHLRTLGLGDSFIIDVDGQIAGRLNINNIVRGAGQYASLGYWVVPPHTGQGVATAAVKLAVLHAFQVLKLHRLEAGTMLHNVASQKVLRRNGFVKYGMAEHYVHIDGEWRDHVLFQRLNPAWTDPFELAT